MQLDAILSLLLRGSDNDLWKTVCFLRARTWTPQGVRIHSLFNISVNRAFNSHWNVCFVYFTFFSLKFSVFSQRFGILSNLSAPVCSRSVCLWRTPLAYLVCVCKSIHLPHYRTVPETFSPLLPVTLCVLRCPRVILRLSPSDLRCDERSSKYRRRH